MKGGRLRMKYRMREESGAWARAVDHQAWAMGYGYHGFIQGVLQAKEMARKPKSWCMLDFTPRWLKQPCRGATVPDL
jgi:hypothetical protein